MMAAADYITIDIEGHGAHAARPHLGIDPVVIGAHMITAMQTIVSRNVDPLKSAVVSITMVQAGNADNVIPQSVRLRGTARSLAEEVRVQLEERLNALVEHTAAAFAAKAKLTYRRNYPVLVNHERQTEFAASVAKDIAGEGRVDTELPPMMGAEDFSFMLNERPGAFIWVGNGDSAGLHHPKYNFNDEAIPFGTSYWVKLVETALAG
jgi:amidohydrolase